MLHFLLLNLFLKTSLVEFTNDSEYLRDLVRRDQAEKSKFSAIKAAIIEGMASGISNKSIPDLMKDVEERMLADGRL